MSASGLFRSLAASVLMSTALASGSAHAAEAADHSAHHADATASNATAAPQATAEHACMPQHSMDEMHATMASIKATADPVERERLMARHMDEMHATMAAMHEHMGRMMSEMNEHRQAAREPPAGRHDHRDMKNLD